MPTSRAEADTTGKLPRISKYWSTDERFADPYIHPDKDTFHETHPIPAPEGHVCNTSATPGRDDPNYDPLFKVRTLIDLVLPRCRDNYKPGCDLSIDEGMIGFKGRLHFRQYMLAKPTKWGIKVWEILRWPVVIVAALTYTRARKGTV